MSSPASPQQPSLPSSPSNNTRPLPPWQPDEAAAQCPLCNKTFTWWNRKHHCRKCGRVVCGSCASNFYGLPSNQVVRLPHDPLIAFGLDSTSESASRTEEVRTCDGCFSRLEQDRCRRMLGLDITSLDPRVAAQLIRDSATSPNMLASPPPSYPGFPPSAYRQRAAENVPAGSSDVPGQGRIRASSSLLSTGHRSGRKRRTQVAESGAASSSAPQHLHGPAAVNQASSLPEALPLRYVAFELTEADKMVGDECPICFEEYATGQRIARLECWCVFHVGCIKAWKNQKAGSGGCPLHFHD